MLKRVNLYQKKSHKIRLKIQSQHKIKRYKKKTIV